jgi:hypothetical protein
LPPVITEYREEVMYVVLAWIGYLGGSQDGFDQFLHTTVKMTTVYVILDMLGIDIDKRLSRAKVLDGTV